MYDLFITKIAGNGHILEYSLYDKKDGVSIGNLAHFAVAEDADYLHYKLVNNTLIKLSQEEIDELNNQPRPPSAEERLRSAEDVIMTLLFQ